MSFRAKTGYGLIALLDLAALYPAGGLLQTREISRDHGIPERYLEQMLTALRKGGFLKSVRGPHGGYRLARPPEEINVAEIEACLEGEVVVDRQGVPGDLGFQALQALGQRAEVARTAVLAATSLAGLLQERESLQQPLPMFYI